MHAPVSSHHSDTTISKGLILSTITPNWICLLKLSVFSPTHPVPHSLVWISGALLPPTPIPLLLPSPYPYTSISSTSLTQTRHLFSDKVLDSHTKIVHTSSNHKAHIQKRHASWHFWTQHSQHQRGPNKNGHWIIGIPLNTHFTSLQLTKIFADKFATLVMQGIIYWCIDIAATLNGMRWKNAEKSLISLKIFVSIS